MLEWYLYCHLAVTGACALLTASLYMGWSIDLWLQGCDFASDSVDFLMCAGALIGPAVDVGMVLYAIPRRPRVLYYVAIDAPITILHYLATLPAVQ